MHKYLHSIGFSNLRSSKDVRKILNKVIQEPTGRQYVSMPDGSIAVEFRKEFSKSAGIVVCGEYYDDVEFEYDYYFPYFTGENVSSREELSVERHSDKESYAGICDDVKVGVSLIFYLQNRMEYIKSRMADRVFGYDEYRLPDNTSVKLSALAQSGTIMFPLQKKPEYVEETRKTDKNRKELLVAARMGDEEAIENLTLDDIDTYSAISRKIRNEDVFSLVDSYFMPYGIECDQYSILGEITKVQETVNELTNEDIYIITLNCNDLVFDVCINRKDLLGEPEVRRRFKGIVWMQGYIDIPE